MRVNSVTNRRTHLAAVIRTVLYTYNNRSVHKCTVVKIAQKSRRSAPAPTWGPRRNWALSILYYYVIPPEESFGRSVPAADVLFSLPHFGVRRAYLYIIHHVCCTTIIIETHIITEVLGFYTYTCMHYKHMECVLSTAAISGYSAIILVYHFPINMCSRLCVCACELYPFIIDAVFTWGFNAVGRKNIYIILSILYACGCTIQMVIEG